MPKILIVEDEPLVARMYEKSLSFEGYDVITVTGGLKGIEVAKKEKPDIILMDIMMPVVNGIEALEKIKADPEISDIPIIMLTNLSGVHDSELAIEKGAVDYLVKKDARPKELGKKIKEVLEGGKAQQNSQ